MPKKNKPGLYGITNSNRDFSDSYYWGKNQFNSSFPVALACYMRDSGIKAIYLRINKSREIYHDELSIGDLFGTTLPNEKLYFSFESRFEPYRDFVHDELETIDLVVKNARTDTFIHPVEIKLTTLPDNTTEGLSEDKYGCELVIRSPTMRYMALSMAFTLRKKFKEIRKIFEPACLKVRNWDNTDEIKNKLPDILLALENFVSKYRNYEKPLLMQPIWKTIGKSPTLANNCLDIFVWSDFALTRLFMDSALDNDSSKVSRQQRAAVRLARFLFEVSRAGKVYQEPIYDGMSLGNQTDKEFAISGNKTYKYMKCDRLTKPIIRKKKIKEIILGGGQKWLSPERRFDAIIYFSTDLFN
ncbi:MAG: HindVP family restriction endonuclease [Victivallales bacterium]|jgi:hypothetical protein